MASIEPMAPWEFPTDLVGAFRRAEDIAIDNEAEPEERISYALKEVLKAIAWEMDQIPLPDDRLGCRTILTQHVLHRIGDQGAG